MRYFIIYTALVFICLAVNYTATAQHETDTQWHFTMQPVEVTAERDWANDTVRYNYNQMKYYVTTVLPYVKIVTGLYEELEEKADNEHLKRKNLRAFVNKREDELKDEYGDEVKKLNETQGVLMIKLIARQTGENIYDMLAEYKSGFFATKWMAWSKLHGFNINRQYNPDDEIMLENIMEELNYPLPAFYKEKLILSSN